MKININAELINLEILRHTNLRDDVKFFSVLLKRIVNFNSAEIHTRDPMNC